ncbi:unnamed protein product [Nippostrongylus brasiliensis]|uniref:Properdin (inferred by orthology to a human protein) n=1 Tax=Nippostrongylus brasiliensis TaxID=27835 RepID=A0A0N4XFD2_NIPBR|nr:unnamed protein product [Nippostrongylus brasiliensis]
MKQYQEQQRQHAQRHPAASQAQACVGGACPAPQIYQPYPVITAAPQTYPVVGNATAPRRRSLSPCEFFLLLTLLCASPSGVWYEWSDWSDCSCTCGDGMKQRRRECSGNNCQGSEYDTAPCNMGPCQTWSEWCEWSTCSASCGRGERTRARFCHLGTQRCEGKDFEVEACEAAPCPDWAAWSEWSRCSASCGAGLAQRQRTCLGGVFGDHMCPGPKSEERVCEEAPCSFWSTWHEWSGCTVSCGAGMKRRVRVCQYGTDCAGPQEETGPCYGPACAAWTEWCEWSGCSSKCGPGQRTRTRACHTGDGADSRDCLGLSVETTLCEGLSCCRWSDWCHWSMCDQECGGGQSIRTRTCMNGEGVVDDNCHCDGVDREQKQCNTHSCQPQCSWTQWCEWSSCSTPNECEIGIKNRSRQCVGESGCHCFGPAEESHQCRGPNPCPTTPPC